MENDAVTFDESTVVSINNKTQTFNMRWLRLKDIYPKLLKDATYSIGETYSEDVSEFKYFFHSHKIQNSFLLDLFVINFNQSSFELEISHKSNLTHISSNQQSISYLSAFKVKSVNFESSLENHYNYIATYSFDSFDVQELKDKDLFIPIKMVITNKDSVFNNVELNNNYKPLLTNPVFSDFVIESSDGFEFKVHRAALAAHSEVFKAMLTGETAENQNNKVRLPASKEEIEHLLQFIYTGSVQEVDSSDWDCLLAMADLYNLPGLSVLAQNMCSKQINNENAIDYLIVSDMHNSELLKQSVLKYISRNPSSLRSQGWNKLKDVNLLKAVIDAINKDN